MKPAAEPKSAAPRYSEGQLRGLEKVPSRHSYSAASGRHHPERTQDLVERYSRDGGPPQPPLRQHASYDGIPVDRNHSR